MGYTENFRELMKSIDNNNRLNYFKSELLKILEKKKIAEQQEKINAIAAKYKDATIESLESEIPELSKSYEEKNKERKKLEGDLKHKKYIVSTEKKPNDRWRMYSKEDIEEAKKFVAENNQKVKDLKAEISKDKPVNKSFTDTMHELLKDFSK